MTPEQFIDRLFMILMKRPATPEEIKDFKDLMHDVDKEMEKP